MELLSKLTGIPEAQLLNISIPKEKLADSLKSSLLRNAMNAELQNIEHISYRAIFRMDHSIPSSIELHVVEVSLLEPKFVNPIAEAFEKVIPYEKIVIFSSMQKHLLFHGYGNGQELHKYQFSDWIYEEELTIDFDLGIPRQTSNLSIKSCWEDWYELPQKIEEIFDTASSSSYLCLRHFVDLLKIREHNEGCSYVRQILSNLLWCDELEFYEETPFVLWSDANQQYLKMNPWKSSDSSIVDRRYGIDRQFEPLRACDFTTVTEIQELLNDAHNQMFYEKWDWDESNEQDDYFDDEYD